MKWILFVGVCLLAFVAQTTLAAGVLHMPVSHLKMPEHVAKHLRERNGQSPAMVAYNQQLTTLTRQANKQHISPKFLGAQMKEDDAPSNESNPIPMNSPPHFYYDVIVANITAGTPPQQFTLAIDFSQPDLFLIGVGVDVTSEDRVPSSSEEAAKTQYDSSASTTYTNPGGKFAGDYGYATGNLASDLFKLGGLSVNMTFGDVDTIDWWINYLPIDGVLGISVEDSANGIPNVLNQLAPQMTDPIMVVHMNYSMETYLTADSNSFISFGSENIPQCSQEWIYPTNAVSHNDQAGNMTVVSVSGVDVNSTSVASMNRSMVIGNFIRSWRVSTQVLAVFVEASGATLNNNGLYEVPCDQAAQGKNVMLTLSDGVTITVTPDDYIYHNIPYGPSNNPERCYLDVYDIFDENDANTADLTMYIGIQFFNNRCISYNIATQQMGIAPLSQN